MGLEWNQLASMNLFATASKPVILTSERISSPTLSCLVAPPCMLVLLIVSRRKSLMLLHPPWRSRSLLPLSANTPSGLVAPSVLLYPPSRACGSQRRNMKRAAHLSSTANVSKLFIFRTFTHMITINERKESQLSYSWDD